MQPFTSWRDSTLAAISAPDGIGASALARPLSNALHKAKSSQRGAAFNCDLFQPALAWLFAVSLISVAFELVPDRLICAGLGVVVARELLVALPWWWRLGLTAQGSRSLARGASWARVGPPRRV